MIKIVEAQLTEMKNLFHLHVAKYVYMCSPNWPFIRLQNFVHAPAL